MAMGDAYYGTADYYIRISNFTDKGFDITVDSDYYYSNVVCYSKLRCFLVGKHGGVGINIVYRLEHSHDTCHNDSHDKHGNDKLDKGKCLKFFLHCNSPL